MTAVYPDRVLVEFYSGTAWVDISAYVVGDINAQRGLGGWQPTNRVAMLGTLDITLNNKAKLFSPMGGDAARGLNTLTGFTRGAKIRVRIFYRGSYYTRWMGRILTIDSDDKNWGPEHARVYATDWMDVPANFPMKRADIALDKTMDEAIALILARLSIQPEATDIDVGTFEFPAVFDGVKNRTMAIGELNKLALSELGYIYVKGDGTLRAENREARLGNRVLDTMTADPDTVGYLLKEDGGYLLTEDGGKIVLDEWADTAVALHTDAESYNILMDRDALFNSAIIRAYPTKTDTSLKVLYSLGKPFWITGKGTVDFSAHYTDPNGFLQASGTNMQTPVATTDYLSNTLEDGTGTDRTADLTVTATYYGDTVAYSVYNDNEDGVWVTFLQARGYGIYHGNSVEFQLDAAASQAAYGLSAFQFDQPYQKNTVLAEEYGRAVVSEYRAPKSRISKLSYLVNLNANHMAAFLNMDVGSLIRATEDRSAIGAHYYITDVQFNIKQGGIVNVTYGLKQNDTLLSGGLTSLPVEFGGTTTDAVNYGVLQRLNNLSPVSISFWTRVSTLTGNSGFALTRISGSSSGNRAGWMVYNGMTNSRSIVFHPIWSVHGGIWHTPTNSLVRGDLYHVVVTYDSSDVANNPVIYLNAVSQVVTEFSYPDGTIRDDTGTELVVGNLSSAYVSYPWPFYGTLFDVRIYNRILSQAEVTTLYNSGTPDVTLVSDGLLFQGVTGHTDDGDATDRDGEVLTSDDTIEENIFRSAGVVEGAPIVQDAP